LNPKLNPPDGYECDFLHVEKIIGTIIGMIKDDEYLSDLLPPHLRSVALCHHPFLEASDGEGENRLGRSIPMLTR
jgi:hypothetical protein